MIETLESLSNYEFKRSQWVRCMAHVINLAVQDFLKEMKASCNEYRSYLKDTTNNEFVEERLQDSAFKKVF